MPALKINLPTQMSTSQAAAYKLEVGNKIDIASLKVDKQLRGFGDGAFGLSVFAYAPGIGFGAGAFGYGAFLQGQQRDLYTSQSEYQAGDYELALHGRDQYGHLSSAIETRQHMHRPKPKQPVVQSLNAGLLTWA